MTATAPHYGEDVAYVHDAGFGAFARRAAPTLLGVLRSSGVADGLVVDLGCGSGIWARALIDAGYGVLGLDSSPAMIAMARRRAPEADLRVASFVDAPLPGCAAVTAMGECLSYALDPGAKPAVVDRLFGRVHQALRPGGVLVFDVNEPGRLAPGARERRWSAGPDWAILVEVQEDRRRRLLTRHITVFREAGGAYRRTGETHRAWLYDRGEVAGGLRRAGFRVRTLGGYGRLRFPPGVVGFLARKRS